VRRSVKNATHFALLLWIGHHRPAHTSNSTGKRTSGSVHCRAQGG